MTVRVSAFWRGWLAELALASLALAAIVAAAVGLARPELRVAAGDADARRFLASFWAREQNATDIYRWAQPQAAIRLFGFEQRAPLLVRVRLSASRPADQPLVQLTLPGAAPALSFELAREWREYTVLLGLALYVALRRRLARGPAFGLLVLAGLALGGWLALAPAAAGYWLPNLWLALALIWLALLAPPLVRTVRLRVAGDARATWGGALALAAGVALVPFAAWPATLGWALLAGGALLLAAALPAVPLAAVGLAPRVVAVALAGITLLALALRLVNLDALPPGMWRDEARHGLLALRILNDPAYRPVYVPTIADIPALLFYLAAVPIGLFGPHAWSVRLVPALCGALTPLALYFLARPLFGARAALLAAALLGISAWHIALSRLAFAATLGPPLTLLALGALWRVLHAARGPGRWAWAALLGGATGLSVYTYHPSRLTPLLVALAALVLLGWRPAAWRASLPALLAAALLAVVVAWPLGQYAIENRAGFGRRLGQTSLFNPDSLEARAPLARLEENVGLNLGIWLVRGDHIGRHNLPDAPQLDLLTGALFAAGAALALAWWRDRRARLLLVWVALALVPGVFSIEAPHAVRTVEAIAPSLLLAGIAGSALLGGRPGRLPAWAWHALPAAVLLAILALNGTRYFVLWPARPQIYEQFYVADTHIGVLAQRLARDPALAEQGTRLFIPADPGDDDVLNYLASGLALGRYDGQALSQPPGPSALLIAYGDRPDFPSDRAATALGPGARQLSAGPRSPLTGQPEYIVFGVGQAAAAAVQRVVP